MVISKNTVKIKIERLELLDMNVVLLEMVEYKNIGYWKWNEMIQHVKYKNTDSVKALKTGATPEVCQRLPLDCCEVGWSP